MQKVAPTLIGLCSTFLAQTAEGYGLFEVPESNPAIYKRFRIGDDPVVLEKGSEILVHDFEAEAYEKALKEPGEKTVHLLVTNPWCS